MATSVEQQARLGALESDQTRQRHELVEATSLGWPEMTIALAREAFEQNPSESELITDDQLSALKEAIVALNAETELLIRSRLSDLLSEPETGQSKVAFYYSEPEKRVGQFLAPGLLEFRTILDAAHLSGYVPAGHCITLSRTKSKSTPMGNRYQEAMRAYLRNSKTIAEQKIALKQALLAEASERAANRWDSVA